ncbi:hypothetical protein JOE57_002842 [Microlunatus panaciterrae]|uniref:Uncharacterized protein n=1 Tax=Microlunatus panaciterrae TaxID=400768 RepID=A0ABS2RP19_9ACTN|nr:hypothetical protein [Microlunatus panaciterrae]MBM7799921.1 hypothetical protein [Microlunatus panaciterrae]
MTDHQARDARVLHTSAPDEAPDEKDPVEIEERQPICKGPAEGVTGDVWATQFARSEPGIDAECRSDRHALRDESTVEPRVAGV